MGGISTRRRAWAKITLDSFIMAGLNHDFLLLPLKEFAYWGYAQLYNDPQAISLHDDIVHYVLDTLKWIPCHNPVRRNKMYEHKGLNIYGRQSSRRKAQMRHTESSDCGRNSSRNLRSFAVDGHFRGLMENQIKASTKKSSPKETKLLRHL
jgi:hypothetical protein